MTAGEVAGISSSEGMAVDRAMVVGFSANAFWIPALSDKACGEGMCAPGEVRLSSAMANFRVDDTKCTGVKGATAGLIGVIMFTVIKPGRRPGTSCCHVAGATGPAMGGAGMTGVLGLT